MDPIVIIDLFTKSTGIKTTEGFCTMALIKKHANVDKLSIKDLTPIDPDKIKGFQRLVVDFLNNNIDPFPALYPGRDKNIFKK